MTTLLRRVVYRERLAFTHHAVISIEQNRITGTWLAWVRPVGYRAFRPATAQQLAKVPFCGSPAAVRDLLAGA
jgi:hypothetical protein